MSLTCKVAVVGAGPYGLSVASHLRHIGVRTLVFGQLMSFWRNQMPKGMLLRSEWRGSHIADPRFMLTLDDYESERGEPLPRRLPLDDFVAYAHWYQQRAVPDLDERQVSLIEPSRRGFRLTLSDNEVLFAERVVVATGPAAFVARPEVFTSIPSEIAPHSAEVRDPQAFTGLRVVVVGAGQSALELAALLHEANADVEVIARARVVHWLSTARWLRRNAPALSELVTPAGEVGPPGINWIVQLPDVFRSLPPRFRRRVFVRAVRPAGSGWLRPRLADVRITLGANVLSTRLSGQRIRLVLDDRTEREVDRVVLGTGYHVDVDRITFLAPELARSLQRVNGSPRLGDGFESSVRGLHFVGATAAESFGPLMRFVAGTGYAARTLTRCIASARVPVLSEIQTAALQPIDPSGTRGSGLARSEEI